MVSDLVARGHLDDAAFARQWVQARAARGMGRARLASELRRRGVDGALVAAALATLSDEDQLERARVAARRRLPALLRADPARAAVRLRDHLFRRGYALPLASQVTRELLPYRDPGASDP